MKLTIFFLLLYSLVHADEIQRIESIVNDIHKLRVNYTQAQEELIVVKHKLKSAEEKNSILEQDLKLYSNYTQKEFMYNNKITSLENQLKLAKIALKNKENEIKICKSSTREIIKTKLIVKKCLNNQIFEEKNEFPLLEMKEKYKQRITVRKSTKAHAYRINKLAIIYDAVEGKKIDEWEKLTSFTSNNKIGDWIQITGYFIDKVWTPAEYEMWIEACDASQRAK